MTSVSNSSCWMHSLLSAERVRQYFARSAVAIRAGALSDNELNRRGRVCASTCRGFMIDMLESKSNVSSLLRRQLVSIVC
jgi:hypothetical protein